MDLSNDFRQGLLRTRNWKSITDVLLAAVDASLLLPTIVSRCQVLPLRGLSCQQIELYFLDRFFDYFPLKYISGAECRMAGKRDF